MDEFEYTHEFISNGGALRVSFRALSEKFIKPEECYVKISDLNTGLCIHYDKFTITKGINFHMDAFVSKDRLSGLLFEILDKKCDVIFQGIQDFGNNIGIYIDGKNYKLKTSLVDNIWWVFDEIFLKKVYEYNGIKVEKGDFVLDLGANYGVFSIYALINGASEIYCVEPSNVTYSYLYDNIKMFNIIKPINCGVGSVTETRKFSLYYESSGGSTLYPTEQCTIDRMIEMVSIVNINQFLNEQKINKIDFLKMDIEGAEYELFECIDKDFLSNKINKIFIEYHKNNDENGNKKGDMIEELRNNNFNVTIKEDGPEFGLIIAKKI